MTHGRAARLAEWLVESGYASIVLDRLVGQARQVVDAEGSSIVVRDRQKPDETIAVAGSGLDEDIVGDRFAAAESCIGRVLDSGKPTSFDGRRAPLLRDCGRGRAGLAVPIRQDGTVYGALAAETEERDAFGPRELAVLSGVAAVAGSALVHAERRDQAMEDARARVYALVGAMDARDGYTASHAETVVELSRAVGERLEMGPADLLELELAALFHDLGKVGVPDEVLRKGGALSREEWAVMHRHPEWGAEILASMPGLEPVATIVRYHHERWDGTGYPDGLAGERIPLASRVISVCDAYNAMTSDRPYRDALTEREAIDQLRAGAGSQFDPRVVDRLVAVLGGRDRSPDSVRQEEAPMGVGLS